MNPQTLHAELEHFSKAIVPHCRKQGRETADKIIRILQTPPRNTNEKHYPIARFRIVGSIGKKTAVCIDPDFDLVVFVNDESPYFKDVINAFEIILLKEMKITDVKKTKYSLQFVANGFSFDLLPARNFLDGYGNLSDDAGAKIQADRAMEFVKKNPAMGYGYGSSMCEETLKFIQRQSAYVHDVVRLAKFWNKTLHIDRRVTGRSTMIELVAVHAARSLESNGSRSCFEGFSNFLELVADFERLCVKWSDIYTESDIPSDVKMQRPLVLDPTNPFNNFAYGLIKNRLVMEKFKGFARVTLERLKNCSSMNDLFAVQPQVIGGNQPRKWTFDIEENNVLNPKMEVKMNEKTFKDKGWKYKAVQDCLLTTMASLTLAAKKAGRSATRIVDVQFLVMDTVDLNILGLAMSRDSGGVYWGFYQRVEDSDVILWIPVPGFSNKCIKIGAS